MNPDHVETSMKKEIFFRHFIPLRIWWLVGAAMAFYAAGTLPGVVKVFPIMLGIWMAWPSHRCVTVERIEDGRD